MSSTLPVVTKAKTAFSRAMARASRSGSSPNVCASHDAVGVRRQTYVGHAHRRGGGTWCRGPSQRSPRHPTHFAFLPSDQWSRAPALCHSFLIHVSTLVRLTLSIALSTSSFHTATSCSSTSIFILFRLDPLPEASLLSSHDTIAPRTTEAPPRCLHRSTTPPTSVHLLHPLRSASAHLHNCRPSREWSTAACRPQG